MAAVDYQSCEDRVLAHEGSEYTDGVNPYDPGGPTRWGITIFDARAFWKPGATADDVRTMPKSVAQDIYRSKYWAAINGDNLPAGVDDCIYDYGINSGNSRAGKVLRRLTGLPDTDWHVTPEVILACSKRDSNALINAICDERLKFLQSLSIWPTYKNGWTTRVKEVRVFALQLAGHEATPVSIPLPAPPTSPVDTGKGTHTTPNSKNVLMQGGTLTAALTALSHWSGAHPVLTAMIAIIGAIAIGMIIAKLQQIYQSKQDAPMPDTAPIPVKA